MKQELKEAKEEIKHLRYLLKKELEHSKGQIEFWKKRANELKKTKH